jgi:hypothetical protein
MIREVDWYLRKRLSLIVWGPIVRRTITIIMVLSLIQIPMNPAEAGETPFPSILIHSDDEFTPANGVFNGSGTASDPYIIEDLLITGPYGRCIEIRNTTKHLLVRNVRDQLYLRGRRGLRPSLRDHRLGEREHNDQGLHHLYREPQVQGFRARRSLQHLASTPSTSSGASRWTGRTTARSWIAG